MDIIYIYISYILTHSNFAQIHGKKLIPNCMISIPYTDFEQVILDLGPERIAQSQDMKQSTFPFFDLLKRIHINSIDLFSDMSK